MADTKISELPSASALTGTEIVPLVQGGTTDKTTTQDIANLSTPDVSGLVPYTGATSDVDLDTHTLNAQSLNVKGTGGNGHVGLKHQSADATASANETVIFAGSDGEPRYKNDGGTVAQFASRAWVTAQGYITNVITALGYTPVPTTRTINGYDLSSNRTLSASDVGAVASNGPITAGTYHKVTVDTKGLVTSGEVVYSLLSGNPNASNATTGGTARYITFSDGNVQNTYNPRQVVLINDVTLKKFYIVTTTSQPASGSSVFTILKNGVDTGIVITIPAGSAAGTYSETSTSVACVEGDTLSVKWVNNAIATSCTVAALSIGSL